MDSSAFLRFECKHAKYSCASISGAAKSAWSTRQQFKPSLRIDRLGVASLREGMRSDSFPTSVLDYGQERDRRRQRQQMVYHAICQYRSKENTVRALFAEQQ